MPRPSHCPNAAKIGSAEIEVPALEKTLNGAVYQRTPEEEGGELKLFRFWGWPAWWLWLLVHIFYLIGFANRLLVMTQWAISLISNRRGVRIFPSTGAEAADPAASATKEVKG